MGGGARGDRCLARKSKPSVTVCVVQAWSRSTMMPEVLMAKQGRYFRPVVCRACVQLLCSTIRAFSPVVDRGSRVGAECRPVG